MNKLRQQKEQEQQQYNINNPTPQQNQNTYIQAPRTIAALNDDDIENIQLNLSKDKTEIEEQNDPYNWAKVTLRGRRQPHPNLTKSI